MEPLERHMLGHRRAEWQFGRRQFLRLGLVGGFAWLTPLSHLLAEIADRRRTRRQAQSVILLWMQGGPSQLETFDPHPGTKIAGGTRATRTSAPDIQIAEGFGHLAEQMHHISLIRSLVSKEGDHERGTYAIKTGYRPDPTVVHPTIGAICCHELPVGTTEIPRHISILPAAWPGWGGFFGEQYDAFKTYDPAQPVPDVRSHVPEKRDTARLRDLEVVERAFARGRQGRVEETLHRTMVRNARKMMTSEQLKAFDVSLEPESVRKRFGDTPFGRGCLAARRLIEVGVRCVEVTLTGWDTHTDNHAQQAAQVAILDPAFAALIRDLCERDLLDRTIVICCGEFGRTPRINPAGGRDHWPKGFTVALAGGGIRGGRVVGATDPEGSDRVENPKRIADVYATVLTALGIDPNKLNISSIGRHIHLTDNGSVIRELLEE